MTPGGYPRGNYPRERDRHDVDRVEDERRKAWTAGLLFATIFAVPLLVLAGLLIPGLAILFIPVAIGTLVASGVVTLGPSPPTGARRGIALLTGVIVAALLVVFGERIVLSILLLLLGAS